MRNRSGIFLVALLLAAQTVPAIAQDRSWQKKWYWGAQGGAFLFKAGGNQTGYSAGGHWFITAGRSALYLAFDQLYFDNIASQTISTGQAVSFESGQRIQATVYAVPTDGKIQVFLGGGFAIHRITDAEPLPPFTSSLDRSAVESAATKAFLVLSGGIQGRFNERWALFGQYQFMPASNDFVIRSQQHAFNIGLRYALTHSEEIVSTQR
ncbi:MAG: hypothetical protein IID06_12215 [Gemmatimonadetes bacterium]|nr:hypothetical protein [Gemmatimonadota bacterium]